MNMVAFVQNLCIAVNSTFEELYHSAFNLIRISILILFSQCGIYTIYIIEKSQKSLKELNLKSRIFANQWN